MPSNHFLTLALLLRLATQSNGTPGASAAESKITLVSSLLEHALGVLPLIESELVVELLLPLTDLLIRQLTGQVFRLSQDFSLLVLLEIFLLKDCEICEKDPGFLSDLL
jgi:hypothetical protein